jgi:hypothetical protein
MKIAGISIAPCMPAVDGNLLRFHLNAFPHVPVPGSELEFLLVSHSS